MTNPTCTRRRLAVVLMVAALNAGGCGQGRPATVRIRGTVILDGQPIPQATVLFVPVAGGVPARGFTGTDGSFTLTSFVDGDGAVAGRHRVAVSKMKVTGVEATEDGLAPATVSGEMRTIWVTPRKYSDVETSGLEIEVTRGMGPVVLALEAA